MTEELTTLNALKAINASYKRLTKAIKSMAEILERTIQMQEKIITLSLEVLDLKNPEEKKIQTDYYIS